MASHFVPPFEITYEGASAYLGNKEGKRLSANTRLYRKDNGDIAVRLYDTDIVTYKKDGSIILYCGRFKTNTTKRYINGCAPVRITQMDFEWYLNGQKWDGEEINTGIIR